MVRDCNKPLLLAAGTLPAFVVLREALDGAAQMVCAETLPRAASLLEGGADLVVCTLRFDESRMFDFLRLAKATAPQVPFVCCRVMDRPFAGGVALDAVALAARSAGADDYVDLVELHRRHGVQGGNAAFRDRLLRLALRPAA